MKVLAEQLDADAALTNILNLVPKLTQSQKDELVQVLNASLGGRSETPQSRGSDS